MSIFRFIDNVSEVKKNESLTAFFTLKGDEEFLKDHFPAFPVMPGVLLLESLNQGADELLSQSQAGVKPLRLKSVEEVKFGQFVKPKNRIKIFVKLLKAEKSGHFFEGRIDLADEKGRVLWASFCLESA